MADYCDQSAAAGDVHFKVALEKARANGGDSCSDLDYPYCRQCGGEIPEARRKALPGCDVCVPCKELEERNGG